MICYYIQDVTALTGISSTQFLWSCPLFTHTNSSLTIEMSGIGLQALPRQLTAQEIYQHVTERLEVISPTLLCDTTINSIFSNHRHNLNIEIYINSTSHTLTAIPKMTWVERWTLNPMKGERPASPIIIKLFEIVLWQLDWPIWLNNNW